MGKEGQNNGRPLYTTPQEKNLKAFCRKEVIFGRFYEPIKKTSLSMNCLMEGGGGYPKCYLRSFWEDESAKKGWGSAKKRDLSKFDGEGVGWLLSKLRVTSLLDSP